MRVAEAIDWITDAQHRGRTLERWQFEVTGGGRVWYLVDEQDRTVWVMWAGAGHPTLTDWTSQGLASRNTSRSATGSPFPGKGTS